MKTREIVVELYEAGATIDAIARELGVRRNTVLHHLDREGIRETKGTSGIPAWVPPPLGRDEMMEVYWGEAKPSLGTLASRFGCSTMTLRKWLLKNDIPIRDSVTQRLIDSDARRAAMPPKPEKVKPTRLEELMRRVEKREDGCWQWLGQCSENGYGISKHEGHQIATHRLIYFLMIEPLPPEMVLHHTCENTGCVNPAHLEPLSVREHLRRGRTFQAANAAKTHCPRGHEYTPENTRLTAGKHGGRECLTCRRERKARSRESTESGGANPSPPIFQ
jgi:hypothetical protein